MTVKNLLIWNSNIHPRLAGYIITPSSGGSFSVPSTMFLDPQIFADEDAAAEVTYEIEADVGLLGPSPVAYLIPEAWAASVQTWVVSAANPLCAVSGNVSNVSGFLELRTEVRFSPYLYDLPLLGSAGYVGCDTMSVFTNYRGDFKVYLSQTIPVIVSVPNASSASRFVVPEDSAVNLNELALETIKLNRNN